MPVEQAREGIAFCGVLDAVFVFFSTGKVINQGRKGGGEHFYFQNALIARNGHALALAELVGGESEGLERGDNPSGNIACHQRKKCGQQQPGHKYARHKPAHRLVGRFKRLACHNAPLQAVVILKSCTLDSSGKVGGTVGPGLHAPGGSGVLKLLQQGQCQRLGVGVAPQYNAAVCTKNHNSGIGIRAFARQDEFFHLSGPGPAEVGHKNPVLQLAIADGHTYVHKPERRVMWVGQQLCQQAGLAHVAHEQTVFAMAKDGADRKISALQHPACGGLNLA